MSRDGHIALMGSIIYSKQENFMSQQIINFVNIILRNNIFNTRQKICSRETLYHSTQQQTGALLSQIL